MTPQDLSRQLIDWRRDFHKHAESAWTEFRTTAVIAQELHALGYAVKLGKEIINEASVMGAPADLTPYIERAVAQGADPAWIEKMQGYTGAVGVLETGKPGPVVAVRVDIDANDVGEVQDASHRPAADGFRSVNDLTMHACAHDGHTAIGLGLARLLAAHKDQLRGTVKLVFQPAEEGLRGGKPIADSGILSDVDYFLAGHLGVGIPFGTVHADTVGFLCSTKFDTTFTGKSAHAGMAPNEGKNALLAAAAATLMLHAIPPHKDGTTRINVGVLNAGIGRNVIAPSAVMKVETRGLSDAINTYMYEQSMKILEHVGAIYDIGVSTDVVGFGTGTHCDPEVAEVARACAKTVAGFTNVSDAPANMGGGDDATWMMKAVQEHGGKATYCIIGADLKAGHHNEYFDFGEDVLPMAVELYYKTVTALLQK